MIKSTKKVNDVNSVILTKKCILVWDKEKYLIVNEVSNTGKVYPGMETFYAEFDTEQELQDYISENNLVE
ncbi:hypothetical protein ACFO4P_05095 [Epilithonimonas pallida]|uniref:Uncharacterized protein n=1 Tax=Epilithonimonas pallida TaxID=373671 RepID=A0ABY1R1F3_9FLAO|nr:hypothetical protein [Epilithonimonas pallida]SMP90043.1 hypothetical protein SAMN05421679_102170 [Epilithonimonas pallida]